MKCVVIQLLLFLAACATSTHLRPRDRLECQNLCHVHCKSNWEFLTDCYATSWSCLIGCANACDDGSTVVGCRSMCITTYQLRCDIAGCKAGCRRGSTRRYQELNEEEAELPEGGDVEDGEGGEVGESKEDGKNKNE